MKKGLFGGIFVCALLVLSLLVSLNLVYAGFSLGSLPGANGSDEGYDINFEYGPRGILSGTINLSLNDVKSNDMLWAEFDGDDLDEVEIRDFLEDAEADYDCSTSSCDLVYASSGDGEVSKSINIGDGESEIVGLKLSGGEIDYLEEDSFSLSFSSDSGATCDIPLKIDILNDGIYEWVAHEGTSTECPAIDNGYGCFDDSDSNLIEATITEDQYCVKVNASASSKLKVGADFKAVDIISEADFIFTVDEDNDFVGECKVTVNAEGEAGCIVNSSNLEKTEFTVCLSAEGPTDSNIYKLSSETSDACGYSDDGDYDFAIFARPMTFSSISDFNLTTDLSQELNLNLDTIESVIEEYLEDVYDSDCTNGCIVPINISSGTSQTVVISSYDLSFSAGVTQTIVNGPIYDVAKSPSIINMDSQVLDLSRANLAVPSGYGGYNAVLGLDNETIIEFDIEVLDVPVVDLLYPQTVPAGIDTLFKIYVVGSDITTYSWDFGDNSSTQESDENIMVHKYGEIGSYTAIISAENQEGVSSPASFSINVISPEDYMDQVFLDSQKNIDDLRTKVATYPTWVKTYFEGKLVLDSKESELKKLKADYEAVSGSASSYVDILNSLEALNIPSDINKRTESGVQFLIDTEVVDASVLETLGAGTIRQGLNYGNAIFEWFVNSMNVFAEEEVYYIIVDRQEQPIGSKIKLVVSPDTTLDDILFIVARPSEEVVFEDASLTKKAAGSSSGVSFISLGSRDISFIIDGEIGILEIPAYFSPSFSQLSSVGGIVTDVCNNNGICDNGETWKNCRNDCKPWGWILFWLFILFLIAFAIYVALQEWYKRKYENHLFKDKNQLYNLINFMDNAEKQGLSKDKIFDKLKIKGWDIEQLNYAWRKYKGLRTGLWEVPVFKFAEKLQVKKEVQKQRAEGKTGRIAPIPGAKQPSKIVQQPVKPLRPGQPIKPIQPGKPMPGKPVQPVSQEPKKGFAAFWDKYGLKIKKKEKIQPGKPLMQNQNINKPNLIGKPIRK